MMICVIPFENEILIMEEHAWPGRLSSMKSMLEQRVLQGLKTKLEELARSSSLSIMEESNLVHVAAKEHPERALTVTLTELGDYVMAVCAIPREPAFFTLIRDDFAMERDIESFVARLKVAIDARTEGQLQQRGRSAA
jgi:hypothetical protein